MKIGFELNNVIRNINKQILKYYQKDFDNSIDLDAINEKNTEEVLNTAKFDSKKAFNEFLYIDYPYEIFGCAKTMEKNLQTKFNYWLENLLNQDEYVLDVSLFSRKEEALSIQSSYFFLSRIGCRVRDIWFPKIEEKVDRYDAIVTADAEFADTIDENVEVIFLTQGNDKKPSRKHIEYETLSELCDDEEFLKKIHNEE